MKNISWGHLRGMTNYNVEHCGSEVIGELDPNSSWYL